MLVTTRKTWELRETRATPEAVFMSRRQVLAGSGALLAAGLVPRSTHAEADPSADLYPARRNEAYQVDRAVTPESISGEFNNFYEFGSHKRIARAAQALSLRPWEIKIDGLVEKPFTLGFDELVRRMPLEERLYRLRCVEAWSMVVPWTGFPMRELVSLARPLGSAKFVKMTTFHDPKVATGQRQTWYPWPYVEGLTMAEATADLALLVTGVYGKPLPKQFGAPLRLAVPWKYGFKSIKSIVHFAFVEERPRTFWEEIAPTEYGFWANVNPQVPHPRWSQAEEEVLGEGEKVPTRLFNGYAEQVAHLYREHEGEKLYM